MSSEPPAVRRLVTRRWEQSWRGLMAIHSRRFADPAAEFHHLRQIHAQRILACLRADIREVTIRKYDLDSPLLSSDEFIRDLKWAVERRDTYVVAGRGRKVKAH